METINKICVVIVIILVVFIAGYMTGKRGKEKQQTKEIVVDTTYNKVTLDSISYNIIEKDSVIYNLKKGAKYEIEQALNANDSVAIEQFKELAGAN